jgi:predicted nuclease with TOPRIM domain
MSNLLKEAIVDAVALKDAALKNAEAAIIEKYSIEVKNTLDKLLEQGPLEASLAMGDDPGLENLGGLEEEPIGDFEEEPIGDFEEEPAIEMDPEEAAAIVSDEDAPLAAADGLPDSSEEGEPREFDLNLGALQEAISELQSSMNESEDNVEISEEEMIEILSEDEAADVSAEEEEGEEEEFEGSDEGGADADPGAIEGDVGTVEEMVDLNLDSLVDAITEKLTVDMGADLSGWAGRSDEDIRWQMEKEMSHRRSTEIEEEMKDLKKAQEELVFENKQLKEQNEQYKQATNELKESLQDVNLSNARLLYTNRVLRNTSLNERQKDRIVEAISNAGSVTEARTIFDTLQSTVESTPKRGPKSLSEAITRNRTSVIRASRQEKSDSSDQFQDRMKRLAGINK